MAGLIDMCFHYEYTCAYLDDKTVITPSLEGYITLCWLGEGGVMSNWLGEGRVMSNLNHFKV